VAMAKGVKADTEAKIVKLNKQLDTCQEVECMVGHLRKIKRAKRSMKEHDLLIKQLVEKAAESAKASDAQKRALVEAAQNPAL